MPALQKLAPMVCAVVSQPDRPAGRNLKMQASPVKLAAEELGLEVFSPEKARALDFVELIEGMQADALIVAAYGQILSERLLNAAKHGGINLHGSLLPYYRGAAPIQRAILNGELTTGVTLMQMDKGMDTGDEIARLETSIGPDETYGELQDRLAILAADLVYEYAPALASGNYSRIQQDHDLATYAPKIEKAEARLDFEQSAELNYRRFRAFTPSPGAYLELESGIMRLSVARLVKDVEAQPGTILASDSGCRIAFSTGALEFQELQPFGKRRMSGRDYLNGMRLRPGDRIQ